MKPKYIEQATTLFAGQGIQVTAGGRRHLGAVIGSVAFREEFVKKHVDEWIVEMKRLSEVAQTQPHAAYSADPALRKVAEKL